MMIRATFRQGSLRTVRDYLIPATVDGVRAMFIDQDLIHTARRTGSVNRALTALTNGHSLSAGWVEFERVTSR